MIRIKLTGTPPSTSQIYFHKGRIVYMSSQGKSIKEGYQWEMKSQYKGKTLSEPISVVAEFYFKDNLRRDVDNFNKLVLDAGSGLLWKDDSQIQELVIRKFIDKSNPRVELIIH